jgi:hypothetical protein
MNLDQIINTQTYTSKLQITKQTIVSIIPDITLDIADVINTLNIGLNNCSSVYIKQAPIKLGSHTINSKLYYYKMKEKREQGK